MKNNTEESSKKKDLLIILEILKLLRQRLIEEFLNKEPEIFNPSFMYENSNSQLNLSVEKYFLSWMNYHIIFFNQIDDSIVDKKHLKMQFLNVYKNLIEKIRGCSKNENIDDIFMRDIINEEIKYISNLLKIGDKAEREMNYLLLQHNKNKVLFDRKIKELKGD